MRRPIDILPHIKDRRLWLLAALTVALFIVMLAAVGPYYYGDSVSYYICGHQIMEQGMVTERMPLYPALLYGLEWLLGFPGMLWGIVVVQYMVFGASQWCIARLSEGLRPASWWAVNGAYLLVMGPLQVCVLTEPLCASMLVFTVYLGWRYVQMPRWQYALGIAAFALAMLAMRPAQTYLLIALPIFFLIARAAWRQRVTAMAIFAVVVVAPFVGYMQYYKSQRGLLTTTSVANANLWDIMTRNGVIDPADVESAVLRQSIASGEPMNGWDATCLVGQEQTSQAVSITLRKHFWRYVGAALADFFTANQHCVYGHKYSDTVDFLVNYLLIWLVIAYINFWLLWLIWRRRATGVCWLAYLIVMGAIGTAIFGAPASYLRLCYPILGIAIATPALSRKR